MPSQTQQPCIYWQLAQTSHFSAVECDMIFLSDCHRGGLEGRSENCPIATGRARSDHLPQEHLALPEVARVTINVDTPSSGRYCGVDPR